MDYLTQLNGHKDSYNITSLHNHGSWKKTMDRVEQAEPRVDHIIIVVIAVFTYRLYRVHACMQEL